MLAQLVMSRHWKETTVYRNDVHLLPKQLDGKVATLRLPALGPGLTVLTRGQAHFIVVEAEGPFEDPHYRSRSVRFSRWFCVVRFVFPVGQGVTVLASGRLLNLCCTMFLHGSDAGA